MAVPEVDNRLILATILLRARTKYAVGVRALAAEFRVSASLISQIERGTAKPSERLLKLYADRFRLDFDELAVLAALVPSDVARHLVENPQIIRKIREDMEK